MDDAEATVKGDTVSGWAKTGGFCGSDTRYYVYFQAIFDQPFTAYGTWKDDSVQPGEADVRGHSPAKVPQQPQKIFRRIHNGPEGTPLPQASQRLAVRDVNVKGPGSGVYLQFDTSKAKPVQMRAALSYVSVDGARKNLSAEVGSDPKDAPPSFGTGAKPFLSAISPG